MLCQACKQNSATVHWSKMVDDKKTELHLCADCAQESGLQTPLSEIPEILGSFLADIFLNEALPKDSIKGRKKSRQEKKCPACGSTYSTLEKKGLLGCAECYAAFEAELKVLLRRVHGNCMHKGRQPAFRAVGARATMEKLRRELQEAILHEKFERAAELRNLIRASESGSKPNTKE